jgi:hypothetical protein
MGPNLGRRLHLILCLGGVVISLSFAGVGTAQGYDVPKTANGRCVRPPTYTYTSRLAKAEFSLKQRCAPQTTIVGRTTLKRVDAFNTRTSSKRKSCFARSSCTLVIRMRHPAIESADYTATAIFRAQGFATAMTVEASCASALKLWLCP